MARCLCVEEHYSSRRSKDHRTSQESGELEIRAKPSPNEPPAAEQIDAIIEKLVDWRGKKLSDLRTVVRNSDNKIFEEVKWKMPSKPQGVSVWSYDGIICMGETLKNAVRLTFLKGAKIKDPKKMFNTRLESNSVRAIDFHEGDKIDETAVKNLVRGALALNVASKAKR